MSFSQQQYNKQYFTNNPKGVFIRQKANARRRGIEWYMTFDEWWSVWRASGKWDLRGNTKDAYCMGRRNDQGPYKIENVGIIKFGHNSRLSILRNKEIQARWNKNKK